MRFDPQVLCQSLKVVDNLDDFIYPFRDQDEESIGPLLDLATARDISSQRNVLAAVLAAELSIRSGTRNQEVKKVLTKMQHGLLLPETRVYIQAALNMLQDNDWLSKSLPILVEKDIHEELPRSRAPSYIGRSQTVRRPVAKISRNAPCHCGSGKKYKKCCLEKDEELLHDASPYAGLTMSQVMASPDLVEDTGVIDNMRAYQLKKVDPEKLNPRQLLAAYRKAVSFGLLETGYNMLLELKGRPEKEQFALERMHDLEQEALDDGNLELSKLIRSHLPEDEPDYACRDFHMFLLENKDLFMEMEKYCQNVLSNQDDFFNYNPVDFAFCFEKLFPALSIIFIRSALLDERGSFLDSKFLMNVLRSSRADLDLDPLDDPVEDYLEWSMDKFEQDVDLEAKDREIQELKQQISEGRRDALRQERELRDKERELENLSERLEKENRLKKTGGAEQAQSQDRTGEQADVAHLKRRIERLKMEIKEQQNERSRLRSQLESKQKEKYKTQDQAGQDKEKSEDVEQEPAQEDGLAVNKVFIPVYTEQFRKSCENLPAGIVAKALRAAAGFASHHRDTLRQSKRLERLSSVYRVRIGLYHRLMIRYEKDELQVLDLIHRQELEKWIRQYSGQAG
ncbi:MAG: hypothetical protein D5S03_08570 [Desulfonatronospira sp. MSAO_Bac3]|nr:MAG: hypothetical protein D5S03_08570 [Desulfonatronospira sp. MSAO_Bac3]